MTRRPDRDFPRLSQRPVSTSSRDGPSRTLPAHRCIVAGIGEARYAGTRIHRSGGRWAREAEGDCHDTASNMAALTVEPVPLVSETYLTLRYLERQWTAYTSSLPPTDGDDGIFYFTEGRLCWALCVFRYNR